MGAQNPRTIRVTRVDTGVVAEMWEGTPCIGVCEAPSCGCDEEIAGDRLRVLGISGTPTLADNQGDYTAVSVMVEVDGAPRKRTCITLAHAVWSAFDEDPHEVAFIEIDGEWVRCHAEPWRARAARLEARIVELEKALGVS